MKRVYLIGWIWISVLIVKSWRGEVVIIENRESSDAVRMDAEFELLFFTIPLGFVNDDKYRHYLTPWHNILKTYLSFSSNHEAYDTRITENYFKGNGWRLCSIYLSDPIFIENGIKFEDPTPNNPIRYELKSVKFHYFSRNIELVKVTGCPVWLGRINKRSRLYFQEINYSLRQNKHFYRGAFVFANIITSTLPQHLEILMCITFSGTKRLPKIDHDPRSKEAEYHDSTKRRIPKLPKIKLYNRHPSSESRFPLFGEAAELIFLTKKYGFINHGRAHWQNKNLVKILDRMGKGYELDQNKMKIIRYTDTDSVCSNYIKDNELLLQYDIRAIEGVSKTEYEWTTKLVLFPMTIILEHGRQYELLKCPILYADNYTYLYILPVYYQTNNQAPQLFTFSENSGTNNEVIPFILFYLKVGDFPFPALIDLTEDLPDSWLNNEPLTD